MSSRLGRAYEHPMDRRSRSSSAHLYQPYHAISEVYTKEVTHHPIGSASEYPPEIVQILREEPRAPREEPEDTHTPPLIRSRENTWTPENFPIVRVPSAQFTDILTELYDYHEVNEKFTRRSVSPDVLRRQSEVPESSLPAPTYQVIPPTPERNTPRHQAGIPLTTTSEVQKKPLPMYEEYVRMQNRESPDPERLRHIDSSSSESSDATPKIPPQDYEIQIPRVSTKPSVSKHPEDVEKRYVYSHDVYVDSTTGRPYTPGSGDVREKRNCDKLKINVYFKPPHPPVEATYKLDEIEIEKHEDVLRPSRSATILSRSASSNPSVPLNTTTTTEMYPQEHFRRIPTSTSILRKEHEILTVPLNRSQSVRQSRVSEHSARRSASKTISQRSIPIHVDNASIDMDQVFPKTPHPQTVTNVHAYPSTTRSTSTVSRAGGAIDKGDYPKRVPSMMSASHKSSHAPTERGHGTPELQFTRGISKTPSVQEYRAKRPAERSPSFISSSHAPTHHKSERTPSEVRIPVTHQQAPPTYQRPQEKRQSPEELDYGSFPRPLEDQNGRVKELPYTRGVSKTPSEKERTSSSSHVHIPYNNPNKERAHQNSTTAKPAASARSSYRSELTEKSNTPELPYTRGISKTPSDNKEFRAPKKASEVHIPFNNPEKERAYQREQHSPKPSTKPHKSRPVGSSQPQQQQPYEEIVHIKERYERDETIRRFFPTTTTV